MAFPAAPTNLDIYTDSNGVSYQFISASNLWRKQTASGATSLSIGTVTGTTVEVLSDTGADAILPAATGTDAGLQSAADKTKLDGVETGATGDQTGAEIKAAYEAEADTNAYTDADAATVGNITATGPADLDQMQTDIGALADGMTYQGNWDASGGGFPGGGTAQRGAFYTVNVGGTVDGVPFSVGDRLIATTDNASATTYASNWTRVDASDAVTTVHGRLGNVVAVDGDYTASNITNVPSGNLAATDMQGAVDELQTEIDTLPFAISQATAPATPSLGDEWFNTADSRWYKWTVDGAASAWVDVSG